MELNIAFLWHMHQPLYIDPITDKFIMPWVRLHSVKAYNDMIEVINYKNNAFVTFNLVPSLLYQINSYLNGKTDKYLDLSRKPPQYLEYDEKLFIIKNFFSCYWPTMVEKYPRYNELLSIRGREPSSQRLTDAVKKFSNSDLLDLQVWFNLAWLGFSLHKNENVIELVRKGKNFSEQDRDFILNLHMDTMRNLLHKYRDKLEKKEIEISTTPFYHPIMPLLYDTNIAKTSNKYTRTPDRFSYPEDVLSQLKNGINYFTEIFGVKPRGLWPSEGSVSMDVIDLFVDAGFYWAATDESILFSSIEKSDKYSLFQPYFTEFSKKPFNMVFRHHHLSDRIGFIYKNNHPKDAVSDLLKKLTDIKNHVCDRNEPQLIAIILDGENPWEYFYDGGESFLNGMYDEIISSKNLRLTTISDYLDRYPPKSSLKRLHPGSWINNDFGIWIGGNEENKAWNMLKKTRDALDKAAKTGNISKENLKRAFESIYIAEGSDWFWWYGDQFHTDFSHEFDYLFRTHLQNVYDNIGMPIPFEITQPIKPVKTITITDEPTSFIYPTIDGLHTHYLEWSGAGSFIFDEKGSAMYSGESFIKELKYGFNLLNLYIKIYSSNDFRTNFNEDISFRLVFNSKNTDYTIFFKKNLSTNLWESIVYKDNEKKDIGVSGIKIAVQEIFECEIPFNFFDAQTGTRINFVLEILQNNIIKERLPHSGSVSIIVPDEDFEKRVWLV